MPKILRSLQLVILLFLFLSKPGFGQKSWSSTVRDEVTQDPIPGAIITSGEGTSAKTDSAGRFRLTIKKFPVRIEIRYLGYLTSNLFVRDSSSFPPVISLRDTTISLNQVVITASRQRQRLEEVTQSVELVTPQQLSELHANQVQEVANLQPGLSYQKGQLTMRGVSGFSYGAGSRVLVMLDDMPMMSADASDVKWNYLPVENLEQIEILKGASSALYGSSALEGVINLRTALPDTPFTQIRQMVSVYDKPQRRNTAYFKENNPIVYSMAVAHRQRIGRFGIVTSANYYRDEGYRQADNSNLLRSNILVSYRPSDTSRFSIMASINGMINKGDNFLIFRSYDEPYKTDSSTYSSLNQRRWHSDQVFKYYTRRNGRHILRNRIFSTENLNSTGQNSTGIMDFSEYQLQQVLYKRDSLRTTATIGVSNTISKVLSTGLYGNHTRLNPALYLQIDQKVNKLNINLGVREEGYKADNLSWTTLPLFRAGLNYQAAKATFLRGSIGQGYRYPSIAEYFTNTVSGAIKIFPNPDLKPESGWNSELGIKQLFVGTTVKGYLDISGFSARYTNMIEYVFGNYPPPLINLGFQAKNLPHTHIQGAEMNGGFRADFGKASLRFMAGYTYIQPYNIDSLHPVVARNKYLPFRRQHLIKGNLELAYRNWSVGAYSYYSSRVMNEDQFFIDYFEGPKDLHRWSNASEAFITDFRVGCKLKDEAILSILIINAFNKEYLEVPGNTNAPRTFSVQFDYQF